MAKRDDGFKYSEMIIESLQTLHSDLCDGTVLLTSYGNTMVTSAEIDDNPIRRLPGVRDAIIEYGYDDDMIYPLFAVPVLYDRIMEFASLKARSESCDDTFVDMISNLRLVSLIERGLYDTSSIEKEYCKAMAAIAVSEFGEFDHVALFAKVMTTCIKRAEMLAYLNSYNVENVAPHYELIKNLADWGRSEPRIWGEGI